MNVSKCWRNLEISQGEMAKIMRVTQQRISQLVKENALVCSKNGKILLVQSLLQVYEKNKEEKDKKAISYDKEKALHEHVKREMAELKLGEMKNDLHKTEDILFIWGNMVTEFRRTLLALPAKMATTLVGKTSEEIDSIITEYIYHALKRLSELDADELVNVYDDNQDEEKE